MGIAVIWLLLNYLLYRALWGGPKNPAAPVPVQMVWEKILAAPDKSTLDVYNNHHKIGFARWSVGKTVSPLVGSNLVSSEHPSVRPEEKPAGYGISFDGSAMLGASNQLRFQTSLSLDTNQNWKDLRVRASEQSNSWSLVAVESRQSVTLDGSDDNGVWNKTWSFADLENPQTWLGDFVDPTTLAFLGLNHSLSTSKSAGMEWAAREDHIKFGQSDLRVYRLDSSILGQHIELVVSPLGEILWVNLPFRLTLRNQALPLPVKN